MRRLTFTTQEWTALAISFIFLLLIRSVSTALSVHQQAMIDQTLERVGKDAIVVVADCNVVNLADPAAMLTLAASFVPGQDRTFKLLREESVIGPSQPLLEQRITDLQTKRNGDVSGFGVLKCLPERTDCQLPGPHQQVLVYYTEFGFNSNNTFTFIKEEIFILILIFSVPSNAVGFDSLPTQPKELPMFVQCQKHAAALSREMSTVIQIVNDRGTNDEDLFLSKPNEKRLRHLANQLDIKSTCGPIYTLSLLSYFAHSTCPNHGIQNLVYQLHDIFGGVRQSQISIGVQDTTPPKWKVPLDKRIILCLVLPKRSASLQQELCPANLLDYLTRYEWAEDNCDSEHELVVLFNKEPIRVDCSSNKQECKLLTAPPSPRQRPQTKSNKKLFRYLRTASSVDCFIDLISGNLLRYSIKVSDSCMKMNPGELTVDIHIESSADSCPSNSKHYSTDLPHLGK